MDTESLSMDFFVGFGLTVGFLFGLGARGGGARDSAGNVFAVFRGDEF